MKSFRKDYFPDHIKNPFRRLVLAVLVAIFGTGFALGFSSLFVYHGIDVVVFGATGSFASLYDPLDETMTGLVLFALWAGGEMLIIRWICGITDTKE